jgi:hypothetical protein
MTGQHFYKEKNGLVDVVGTALANADCVGEGKRIGRVRDCIVDLSGAEPDAGGVEDAIPTEQGLVSYSFALR